VVLGGGTVLVPDLAHRHVRPRRVLLLPPELAGVSRAGGNVTIGAATRVSELETADEPLATAARHLADREVRAQATVASGSSAASSSETRVAAPIVTFPSARETPESSGGSSSTRLGRTCRWARSGTSTVPPPSTTVSAPSPKLSTSSRRDPGRITSGAR
jgi:hypothetical protein